MEPSNRQALGNTSYATVYRFRLAVAADLEAIASFLDRHVAVLPGVLFALFFVTVWISSLHKQLWHDELFTFLIARAPDWHTLLIWTRTLDLNPPLSFAFTRLSLHAFGVSPEAGRLPFMLGVVICGLALFRTVLLLTGSSIWASLGLALLLEQYKPYALEMRPYGLQAGFLAIAVLAWQHIAVRRKGACGGAETARVSSVWFILLSSALAAGLLSHLFFILIWASFCFAEAVRYLRQKEIGFRSAVALLVPMPVMYFYRPIFAMHAASYFPKQLQPKWRVLPWFYVDNGRHLLWMLFPGIFACLFLWGFGNMFKENFKRAVSTIPRSPWTPLLLPLGSAPGILVFYLHVTHGAFFWRYGFVIGYTYALIFTASAFVAWQGRRSAGLLIFAGVALIFGDITPVVRAVCHPSAFHRPAAPACSACLFALTHYPQLPLVVANGLTFVEMNEREPPETLRRLVYIMDRDAEIKFAHATIFEGMPAEHDAWGFVAPVLPYSDFTHGHREFLVYGSKTNPEEWLLAKLEADGAQIELLTQVDHSGYEDEQIWEVLMPPVST